MENLHIIGAGHVGDKRPEHHDVGQMTCRPCDAVDALEAFGHASPLWRVTTEVCHAVTSGGRSLLPVNGYANTPAHANCAT